MKVSNKQALELLENLPLQQVSNEANFLAPLHVKGRTASVLCEDPNYGRRLVAGELGTDDVFWEYEMENGKVRVIGTLQESARPVKVVS